MVSASAAASTITQNTSWTIDRAGTSTRYRIVAYGDSIFAGYNGALFSVARRAGPMVAGEYAATRWGTDVEVVRRAKSGARADDIYNNKVIRDRSYMQASNTRVVTIEMCGNDYLQARSSFSGQSGTCNYGVLDSAYNNCALYTERSMQAINQYATTARAKIIANLYYPGFDADNVSTGCRDAGTGQPINKQTKFLEYLARSNWMQCDLARRYGFSCADSFAEFMVSDPDTAAVAYRAGESQADYVARIFANRALLRDSNFHLDGAGSSFDYLQSDNTHPTNYTSATIGLNWFTGTGSGSGAPTYQDGSIVGGKNPQWNRYGHERMGWSISTYLPATP
jgi:lysophospholipase L1-like esterase